MSNEKMESPSTLKYSIWETRTKEKIPAIKEKTSDPMGIENKLNNKK
ncbi:hypothetical protein R4Z09_15675 [Niallia oryzisoli]|uniref:Uncharacterized protein n=1 Tax=Niallia oryzisoli TaxID=1737571 RepID=A0ABZ2C7E4_9BACI